MAKAKKYVRPVQVRYYADRHDMPDNYVRWGSYDEIENVVRGAYFHIAKKRYAVARIYEDGICTHTVRLNDHGFPQGYFGGKPMPLPTTRSKK